MWVQVPQGEPHNQLHVVTCAARRRHPVELDNRQRVKHLSQIVLPWCAFAAAWVRDLQSLVDYTNSPNGQTAYVFSIGWVSWISDTGICYGKTSGHLHRTSTHHHGVPLRIIDAKQIGINRNRVPLDRLVRHGCRSTTTQRQDWMRTGSATEPATAASAYCARRFGARDLGPITETNIQAAQLCEVID